MKQELKVTHILANGERVSSIEGKVIPVTNTVYEQVLKGVSKNEKNHNRLFTTHHRDGIG